MVWFVFGAVLMVWNVLFLILLLVVHISSTILYCLYKDYQVYSFSTEYLPQSKESTISV
jgi:ABC-type Mn2+/Zn2+ transport system permease subunit